MRPHVNPNAFLGNALVAIWLSLLVLAWLPILFVISLWEDGRYGVRRLFEDYGDMLRCSRDVFLSRVDEDGFILVDYGRC